MRLFPDLNAKKRNNQHTPKPSPLDSSAVKNGTPITTFLRGGRTQNASCMFQGVFEGGLENASLHFEGILKTLPTRTTPGDVQQPILHLGGGMYLTLWYGPPWKSSLKGVVMNSTHAIILTPCIWSSDHSHSYWAMLSYSSSKECQNRQ